MSRIAWEGDEEMLRAIDAAAGKAKQSREEFVAAAVGRALAHGAAPFGDSISGSKSKGNAKSEAAVAPTEG